MDKNKKINKKECPSCENKSKITLPPSKEDPMGSYTGVPVTPGETPTQDADDL